MDLLHLDTPVGTLAIGAACGKLVICDWTHSPHFASHAKKLGGIENDYYSAQAAAAEIREYFAGHLKAFTMRLAPVGTPFQQRVWMELGKIPYGHTDTYSSLARRIGKPQGARCVANAIGSNPISIIIPCHRIIGADGTLTGYAGGIEVKASLLALEKSVCGLSHS
ncbi:MAG: methylated-DNA--[protein]-cysteine S-methyltransferase [Paramuribaculum sp.]|nr:methylated-DNA--[protein]-cysteine S-methyltransferase [Paramuribaculum sp.]